MGKKRAVVEMAAVMTALLGDYDLFWTQTTLILAMISTMGLILEEFLFPFLPRGVFSYFALAIHCPLCGWLAFYVCMLTARPR